MTDKSPLDTLIERYNHLSIDQLRMKADYISSNHYPDKKWSQLTEEKVKLEMEIIALMKGEKTTTENIDNQP